MITIPIEGMPTEIQMDVIKQYFMKGQGTCDKQFSHLSLVRQMVAESNHSSPYIFESLDVRTSNNY